MTQGKADDVIGYVLARAMQLVPELTQVTAKKIELESHQYWGGENIYIPKELNRNERNQRLMADYITGITTNQLALKYRLSERRIRQIINIRSR